MREHEVNKLDNFICGYYADNNSFCDTLINFHKTSDNKNVGTVGYERLVDKTTKDSTDVHLYPESPIADVYAPRLMDAVYEYVKRYPTYKNYGLSIVKEAINIQHYNPKGGFHRWHCERTSCQPPVCNRNLVFITYLNDVHEDGETEFYYQKIKIKPEKGLTIIFPTDWNFTHRGIPAPSEEKYIATGWFSYIE